MSRDLNKIVAAARQAILSVFGTPKDSCIAASAAIKSVFADAEIWSCLVEGQMHVLAKVDGMYLDATCDQFGDYCTEVVFSDADVGESDLPHYAFRPAPDGGWERQSEVNAAFVAALKGA